MEMLLDSRVVNFSCLMKTLYKLSIFSSLQVSQSILRKRILIMHSNYLI